ncbi:MAG: UDP-N-acetylmuramate:L-alanyl-gamma-D-glutamyl-meso-diaminopimelate ligase [Betaproteobacteria bacterium]|nr:UDP-N-acetylmuramate:L-alanyl-gamma-D-glutamyl-meso-diaminopimelate ligase [Betaproteobacteria bacterium]
MPAHIHILGICGTFMGGLAVIAKQAGYRVSGCDANVYPPMSDQLASLGVELIEGYGADQIGLAPDLWVVGNVVTRGNPLMEAILDLGERYASGPQWLSEHVLFGKCVLTIAGTHGKTTTASMLAWILDQSGVEPSYLIGGVPSNFGVSARLTGSRFVVLEADEYDTAFFDKRSKFVHYRPRTAVLNNLEYDHADIFGELADIERQFHHFVRTLPASGLIVTNGADAALKRVLERGCWTPVEHFGAPGGWEAGEPDGAGGFEVTWRGQQVGRVAWDLLGRHNQLNALAAIAAARHAGVAPEVASAALGTFAGVKRRMELRGRAGGITVYDDFAHHPTAIRSTLAGLRRRVGRARILAVLEPRSNTMKLGVMNDALPESLADADRAFVYSSGLGWDAEAVFRPLGQRCRCLGTIDALVAAIDAEARAGDHVVVMSNGAFGGIHGKLLTALARPGRREAALPG